MIDITKQNRRRYLINTATLAAWSCPVITAIALPAHAQTSTNMCITDVTVGGPLAGNASGASSCQTACEAEATSQNAQLCEVRETSTTGGTDCACDLDLP